MESFVYSALVGGATVTGGVTVGVVVVGVLGSFLQAEASIKILNVKIIGFIKGLKINLFDIGFLKCIWVN